ncbi:MAG: hypothetical protein EBZ40_12590, partial [Gammaproteobacteria bacterium]|nr:hypothetical protein [Gammaproteobacteria bacterium]
FLPASPELGASPEQILRGFIDAASSPQNDYAVAREFLSMALNVDWKPNARVIVDGGSRDYVVTADGTITLVTQSQAVVDERGDYSERDIPERVSLTYSFVQENGEWRIASAPEGVLLERYTFDQIFGQHALYFFDPTFSLLVPDVRYFPSRASTPTRIMKALLAGPSPWLASSGAVVTAFPPDTQLVAETVPITGTSASVDITGNALNSTLEQKRLMLRQAAASLSSLSSIFTVQLSIAGVPQDISAQSEDVQKGYPQVDARHGRAPTFDKSHLPRGRGGVVVRRTGDFGVRAVGIGGVVDFAVVGLCVAESFVQCVQRVAQRREAQVAVLLGAPTKHRAHQGVPEASDGGGEVGHRQAGVGERITHATSSRPTCGQEE